MKFATLLLFPAFALLTSCSTEQLKNAGRQVGQEYQCKQENANRPDSFQREIECQQAAKTQGNN